MHNADVKYSLSYTDQSIASDYTDLLKYLVHVDIYVVNWNGKL